jgi:hypothetical protein
MLKKWIEKIKKLYTGQVSTLCNLIFQRLPSRAIRLQVLKWRLKCKKLSVFSEENERKYVFVMQRPSLTEIDTEPPMKTLV